VVGFLFARADTDSLLLRLKALDTVEFITAAAIFFPFVPLQAERLRRVVGLIRPVPFGGILALTWIGAFFNQTLPSSMGGDLFRVWYLREHGLTLTQGLQAAIADRMLGLIALLVVLLAGLPWFFLSVPDFLPRLIIVALVGGGFAGLAFILGFDRLAAFLPAGLSQKRLVAAGIRLGAYLRRATVFSSAAAIGFLLSLTAQLLQSLMVWCLGQAMHIQLELAPIVFFLPLANLAAMLPVSIAGWGLREAVLVAAFGLIGLDAESALALSVLVGLASLAVTLPGLPIWLVRRGESGSAGMSGAA
jgi:uncharacterized protein (TIRG00374 family)